MQNSMHHPGTVRDQTHRMGCDRTREKAGLNCLRVVLCADFDASPREGVLMICLGGLRLRQWEEQKC